MPPNAAASFTDALSRTHLLEAARLDELVRDVQPRFPGPRELAGELIRRGWLTPFQANQLLQGRGEQLLLGSYVLLERIGEGGMGQVFKARNWKLGQVVALKLIRKERLQNADALRRFHREIRAASQLDHPNIVRAIDADEVGGTHLFVMECVPGVDLAKHVREFGPAPVDRACDYARQAALGLQHASERGLVHRDIKPSNLLLTPQGVVKILDMGLARAQRGDDDASGAVTTDGAIMGTLDYIAPEQAMNSHDVDVRADLYSLGCTLYFLLTGRVPFPGAEALEKLLKHRLNEPEPVERLRPDVPPGVAALVRKLMAKRPEDRFQTAADAAAALASAASGEGAAAFVIGAVRPAPGPRPSEETDAYLSSAATAVAPAPASPAPRRPTARRIWPWVVLGAASGIVLALTAVILFARRSPDAPAVAIPGPPAAPEPTAFDRWVQAVAILPAEHQSEAVGEELKKRNPGFDGTVKATVENGVVTGLDFLADNVTDIAPVRALPGLKRLTCRGSAAGKGRLSDLSPLRGMPLAALNCSNTAVSDLAPLQGTALTSLTCTGSKVSDLAPLKGVKLTTLDCSLTPVFNLAPLQGMPLTTLNCSSTPVSTLRSLKGLPLTTLNCDATTASDLAPLQGMPLATLSCAGLKAVSDLSPLHGAPLTSLNCSGTNVSDLAPLKGMKLTNLDCRTTLVADLSPLEGMPLTTLYFNTKVSDLRPLKGMQLTTLNCVNTQVSTLAGLEGMPLTSLYCTGTKVADLSPLKGMKLTILNCGNTQASDLSPLTGMPLTALTFTGTKVADLVPLKGMKLTVLDIRNMPISDLSPLEGMPLTTLYCGGTKVADLSPLRGMKLTYLDCNTTPASDLSSLRGMKLTYLDCSHTAASDLSPLIDAPLKTLLCDFKPERDAAVLRSIKTLETINGKAAAPFWKAVDEKKP